MEKPWGCLQKNPTGGPLATQTFLWYIPGEIFSDTPKAFPQFVTNILVLYLSPDEKLKEKPTTKQCRASFIE